MGKLEIMLKQYEFLRKEIVQCIYLRQLAIVGIFTTILAGLSVLLSESVSCQPCGSLQLGAIGMAFLVNCFGSLYVHEQHRNRRACHFNLMLERLMTKEARDTTIVEFGEGENKRTVSPIIGWENFLMKSKACKRLNGPFYVARYLGVSLPILVFSVPLVVAVLISFPTFGLVLSDWKLLLPLVVSLGSVSVLVMLGLTVAGQWKKSKDIRFHTTWWCMGLTGAFYLSPLVIVLIHLVRFALSEVSPHCTRPGATVILGFESPLPVLIALVVVGLPLGFWTLYIFFNVMKWLGESAEARAGVEVPMEEAVGQWIADYCKELDDDSKLLKKWDKLPH